MKNLRTLLEDADPLRAEPVLPMMDAREIRRTMLGAVETMRARFFPRALPVAALVVVMLVAGAAAGRRLSIREPLRTADGAGGATTDGGERRQVQFATPGGTRIIWTIDPNFHMREVMP
jgi:hypothetical protein